ncbi:hypothetical protein ACWEWQ_22840, partial [Streptomyces sp. NPDC003832]
KYSVTAAGGDMVGASPLISGLFHDEPTIEALLGGFTVENTPTPSPRPAAQATPSRAVQRRPAPAPHPRPTPDRSTAPRRAQPVAPAATSRPVSGVQQLLALAQQGGAR